MTLMIFITKKIVYGKNALCLTKELLTCEPRLDIWSNTKYNPCDMNTNNFNAACRNYEKAICKAKQDAQLSFFDDIQTPQY